MLKTLIQIIAAIIIVIILGIIAYSVYNSEITRFITEMSSSVIVKKPINIFKGIMPLNSNVKPSYTTFDKSSGTFRDLKPSINQKGGAEYSYNFWIYMNDGNLSSSTDSTTKVLFVKGNNTKLPYVSNYNCHAKNNWYLVKNPLVRVNINNQKVSAIVTEFNTIKSVDAFHNNPEKVNCDDADYNMRDNNLFGIYGLDNRTDLLNKWSMVTIVVSETNPSSDIMFRNEAVVKMYLNGYEYFNKTSDAFYSGGVVTTAMRNNSGNLYVNPDKSDTDYSKLAIADLTYFNYALTDEDVLKLHKGGFNNKTATIPQEMDFDELKGFDASELETEKSNMVKQL